MNRLVIGGCVGIGVASLIGGAISLGFAFGARDYSRIEYGINKLKCELFNK